jgi:hypothetical protein
VDAGKNRQARAFRVRELMDKKTKKVVGVAILAAVLAASIFEKIHFAVKGAGATVYSRGDEAVLLLGDSYSGYKFPYLKYPLVMALGYLRVPADLSDQRAAFTLMRVTPSGIERHQIVKTDDSTGASFVTPFEDGFYAMCPGTVLCKLTERGFERASEEERRRLDDGNLLVKGSMYGQTIHGWTVHYTRWSPGDHFEADIGKSGVISVTNLAKQDGPYLWVIVELTRPGQKSETLYDVNGAWHWVSEREYRRIFGVRDSND